MNIGYARVSTEEQNLDLQTLEAAGYVRIFSDRGVSGSAREPQQAQP
jgi:DNA invertase Pin-like site-specific DNA recombinase